MNPLLIFGISSVIAYLYCRYGPKLITYYEAAAGPVAKQPVSIIVDFTGLMTIGEVKMMMDRYGRNRVHYIIANCYIVTYDDPEHAVTAVAALNNTTVGINMIHARFEKEVTLN